MAAATRLFLVVLMAGGLLPLGLRAQQVTAGQDSTRVTAPKAERDTSRQTERFLGWHVTRPKKAALLSAMLPGAGQIYNRRYWKLPLVYGGLGVTLGTELAYQKLYKEYSIGYEARLRNKPDPGKNSSKEATPANVKVKLDFYRRQRDVWIAYTAVVYTLNIVDALVDAHLRDFDISDDLSLQWQPDLLRLPTTRFTPGVAVSLTLKSKKH